MFWAPQQTGLLSVLVHLAKDLSLANRTCLRRKYRTGYASLIVSIQLPAHGQSQDLALQHASDQGSALQNHFSADACRHAA